MPTPLRSPVKSWRPPLPIVRVDAGPEDPTFQTSRFARNLENRGIIFTLSRRRNETVAVSATDEVFGTHTSQP